MSGMMGTERFARKFDDLQGAHNTETVIGMQLARGLGVFAGKLVMHGLIPLSLGLIS